MKFLNKMLAILVIGMGIWALYGNAGPEPLKSLPEPDSLRKAKTDTVEWDRPRFSERQKERHQMVRQGIEKRGVSDSDVLKAMRHVPRHLFVPQNYQQFAYQNRPLPIGQDQTISQPFIVGYMTEMLNLQSGDKVLEIGTGSGYQAAILSELTPYVFTIEIVKALGKQARSRFDKLGYDTIKTMIGDGYKGWPEHAPFNAIILTAAPKEIPEPLLEQLKPGGILVAPLGRAGGTQFLTKATKSSDGKITIQRKLTVRFVPMTGEAQEQ